MMDALVAYTWPGNIRQLQNMLYQFLVLGKLDFLDPKKLKQGSLPRESEGSLPLKAAVEEFEKQYITKALARNHNKKGRVAEQLGMDRKTLFRKIKRYDLK